jgi:hypothetical protein
MHLVSNRVDQKPSVGSIRVLLGIDATMDMALHISPDRLGSSKHEPSKGGKGELPIPVSNAV